MNIALIPILQCMCYRDYTYSNINIVLIHILQCMCYIDYTYSNINIVLILLQRLYIYRHLRMSVSTIFQCTLNPINIAREIMDITLINL